ncbi:MAG: ABC transporter permease [Anaerolineae bacterium]|nr:ABC transporter permease [Anaerolineae bacterium]
MDGLYRIVQIARKESLELWRKAGVVAFILAIPLVEMIVLGYATAGRIDDLPAAIHDADHSPASRRLIQSIDQSRGFAVTHLVEDVDQAERMLEANQVNAIFVIPSQFERSITGQESGAAVAVIIDGSNTAVAGHTAAYAEEIVAHFAAQSLGGDGGGLPVSIEPRIWYNQGLRRENFYIPALLGAMLSLVILAITAVSIVRERERGTLEQLMVAPIRPLELIAGKLAPIAAIAYAELGMMLLVAICIFDIPVAGSLPLYAGLMFVYLLAEMGVGILISTLSRTQAQALPTILLLVTTSAILAGFFTPVDLMPPVAQRISSLVPLRYFVAITRDLFAKGAGLGELAPQLIPLVGMSVLFFASSTWLLRRKLV